MPNDTSIVPPNGQAPNGTDPQAQAATSTGQVPNETPNVSTEDLLRQIKELRSENAVHRKKAQEQLQVAQATEQARLAEQGQFKQLAEQHAARVQELEPVASRYAELSTLVSGQIEAQIQDWPPEVKAFDPGKDAPIEQRLTWLEKSKPLIEKLQVQARATNPGNVPNPRPVNPTRDDAVSGFMKQLRASGKYGA
jgi:hypothetical protein